MELLRLPDFPTAVTSKKTTVVRGMLMALGWLKS